MSVNIGRKGWLGIATEVTPGTAVQPVKYFPYDSCTLKNTVEVLDDEAAKGIREKSWGSVAVREKGEGDIEIKVDVENAPYLLIPALGTVSSTSSSGAKVHTITRKADNPPKTVTLIFNDTVESRKFTYGTVNTLEIAFTDGWITAKAAIISKKPETGTGTKAITEETVLAFKDAKIYFGTNLTAAMASYTAGTGATKLSAFTLNINNNAEPHYLSGSTSPDHIASGQFELGGQYTLFFESTTERAAHEAQTSRAMVVSFLGKAIGTGEFEEILIKIPKFHITERSIDTAPAGFVTENPTFVADYESTVTYSVQVIITNMTASY